MPSGDKMLDAGQIVRGVSDTTLNAGIYYGSCAAAQQLMEVNERTFSIGALSLIRRY
jgi:hypothetical protein